MSLNNSIRQPAILLPEAELAQDGLPVEANTASFRPHWSVVALVWLIRLVAGLNLYASLLNHRPKLVHWLGPWMPFEVSEGRPERMLLAALLLFVLASGLQRGKRIVWLCTIITLTLAPFLHLGRVVIWPQVLVNLTLVGFLLLQRRYFVAQSDRGAVRSALVICPLLSLALLILGTVRLHDFRNDTSGDDDWFACAQTACELVLVQKTHTQQPLTDQMRDFFFVLRAGGTSIAALGLFLTLRPVLLRRRNREDHLEKVNRLIEKYGQAPFDPYALLPDKDYFFTEDGQAVISYVLSGSIAVALANPIGSPAARVRAIGEFALFCRRLDWEPVFYALTEDMAPHYRQAGFSLFKIGEGARLRTEDFHLQGGAFQNLRTLCNKARKLDLQFRWYDSSEGIDTVLERQLESISQSWIEIKKAREMSFDMGVYSLADIRENGAAVTVDAMGNALAFATWRPFRQGEGRTLDLMRHLPHSRNIMDFVLVESILHFRQRGIRDICLGLAPLANTDAAPSRLLPEEKVVQFLFENLNYIYGYKSLFEFKRKYRPAWLGHYVAYRRGVHLPMVGLALVRVHAPDGLWKFLMR